MREKPVVDGHEETGCSFLHQYFLILTSTQFDNMPSKYRKKFQIDLELLAKNLFWAAILNFYDKAGS